MSACSGDAVEEVRRVAHDELIDRRAARDQDRGGSPGPAAGAAGALPGRGDRARIAGHHRHVERADVDAELQRVGRDDGADQPVAQPALDLAPPVRQIAAAIAAHDVGRSGRTVERVLQIRRQDLDREPALREQDELQVVLEELERDPARFREIRTADAQLRVDHRRVDEQEELLAARRAALVDQRERPPGQPLGELARIGDRRRRADEHRVRAVVPAHPLQPPQDVGQVAAEHAAIGVQLVDHHEAQVLEQLGPARVVRQDARVQHVGIAQHHVRLAADRAARVRRRVAVVGEHADRSAPESPLHQLGQRVQLRELILRQRLGREQIERARGGSCRIAFSTGAL